MRPSKSAAATWRRVMEGLRLAFLFFILEENQRGEMKHISNWVGNTSPSSPANSIPPTKCLELPWTICCHVLAVYPGIRHLPIRAKTQLLPALCHRAADWKAEPVETNTGRVRETRPKSSAINFWKAPPCLAGPVPFHVGSGAQQLLWLRERALIGAPTSQPCS